MDKINLVLPFLFAFLAHVLALCHKSHFSVLIHPHHGEGVPPSVISLCQFLHKADGLFLFLDFSRSP